MSNERIQDWLDDLARFAEDAAYIVSHGSEAYGADTAEGRLLRNAGERLLIKVATVAERLPETFKAQHPDVEWRSINRMRNLVAHHYDKINHDLMWSTLKNDLPALLDRLRS